jgi:hypothetical protein
MSVSEKRSIDFLEMLCGALSIRRQALHVCRNTEARSCNSSCRGKAISSTYSERVFAALGIRHAMHIHIISCGILESLLFFHITS